MFSSIILRHIASTIIIFTAFLATNSTLGGVGTSLMQTADVKRTGDFEVLAQGDIIFNQGGGFNFSAHTRTGIIDQILDLDVLVGSGKTSFQTGALAKYNFLPDIEGQLGLSFIGGSSYLRDDIAGKSESLILVTLGTIVSKTVDLGKSNMIPYGSFEFEMLFGPDDTSYPMTLIVGSKWLTVPTSPWVFYSEFGFKIKDSFYSFSVGAGYSF